jgi:hypothetical protein
MSLDVRMLYPVTLLGTTRWTLALLGWQLVLWKVPTVYFLGEDDMQDHEE